MDEAGGLVDLMQYLILVSMGLYIFPIILYGLFFKRGAYFVEILVGVFSFLFYSPTYLNLLNVYALCRIDDISWGTKGLDAASGGKNAHLKETWKVVKMIDVAKFVMWNSIFGFGSLFVDEYLLIKFFLMLSILCLFILVLGVKMFIGMIYLCKYKCIIQEMEKKKNDAELYQTNEEGETEVAPEAVLEKKEPKMHIYSVMDAFEEMIRNDIKMSFEMAAYEEAVAAGQSMGLGHESTSRVSKANVAFAFGENQLQNMRKNNELRKSFYPDINKHRQSRMARQSRMDEAGDLGLHLLQRRVENEATKAPVGPGGNPRDVSMRFSKIRETFFNRFQSKRMQ